MSTRLCDAPVATVAVLLRRNGWKRGVEHAPADVTAGRTADVTGPRTADVTAARTVGRSRRRRACPATVPRPNEVHIGLRHGSRYDRTPPGMTVSCHTGGPAVIPVVRVPEPGGPAVIPAVRVPEPNVPSRNVPSRTCRAERAEPNGPSPTGRLGPADQEGQTSQAVTSGGSSPSAVSGPEVISTSPAGSGAGVGPVFATTVTSSLT